MEMDIVDEQIDTVGRAFMGLTLGCARCHDHKFDPIATTDYYALAGIFRSTRTMETFKKVARWHENSLAGARERARQGGIREAGRRAQGGDRGPDPDRELAAPGKARPGFCPAERPRIALPPGDPSGTETVTRGPDPAREVSTRSANRDGRDGRAGRRRSRPHPRKPPRPG